LEEAKSSKERLNFDRLIKLEAQVEGYEKGLAILQRYRTELFPTGVVTA
jgi:hypothetical protein